MSSVDQDGTPRQYGRIPRFKGFLPLNEEPNAILSTHGKGTLSSLIRNASTVSLHTPNERLRRPSSFFGGREVVPDEEAALDLKKSRDDDDPFWIGERRASAAVLMTPQMRSMRLIGNSNPRYKWSQYWKTEEELKKMTKPLRKYYERNNFLIQNYIYIDRLLDSSLPHNLLNEYTNDQIDVPTTIAEEPGSSEEDLVQFGRQSKTSSNGGSTTNLSKVKRTKKDLFRPTEATPLIEADDDEEPRPEIPELDVDSDVDTGARVVQVAIHVNLFANISLLAGKIAVTLLTSSLSVLASLVDAALDFLSTAIVWTTSRLIARSDSYLYPVGRRRLEPVGVLVFATIMTTAFVQVAIECISRLNSGSREIVVLGPEALIIMTGTVLLKGACWLWCRNVKNSSVQALAQDASTDVVFNIFSIIFPIVGQYLNVWWLDGTGGLLLSGWVVFNWAQTAGVHIRHLSGAAADADSRNVILYLVMRFASTIKAIQGLQAYHSGDKLLVEVDIILDESISLRDSHDLGESLQYVIEAVPYVERVFVHSDYATHPTVPTHLEQSAD